MEVVLKMVFKGLKLDELQSEEVLFFIRIRGRHSYFENVYSQKFIELFKSINNHRCISEYKKDADVYIDLKSIERDYLYQSEYNAFESLVSMESVIKRCRGLRSIPYTEASKLAHRAYLFFESFFLKNKQIKLLVTGAIDNYVMDLMVRIGELHGVIFLGVTDSLMSPEYKLITLRGELNCLGGVDDDQVSLFSKKIQDNVNSCTTPKLNAIIKRGVFSYLSYRYRFIFRHILKYKLLGRLEYDYRFLPYFDGFTSLSQIFALKYLTSSDKILNATNKPKAYIPLHWYPEATTDYWINSMYHINYLSSVIDTIKKLQKLGYEVFAKEHPHFLLRRKVDFYKHLKANECQLLSPFICTRDVFDKVDLVVVWNGSTGIEALLHGKDTRKVVNSYYGDDLILSLDDFTIGEGDAEVGSKKLIAENCIEKVYRSSFRTS
jgi:hypothetical protein